MTLSVRLAALIVCLLIVAGIHPGFAEEVSALVVSDESARSAESRRSPVFRKALVAVAQELLKRKVTPKGAEEVLPQHEPALHALERLEVLPLLLQLRARLVDALQREQLGVVALRLLRHRGESSRARAASSLDSAFQAWPAYTYSRRRFA